MDKNGLVAKIIMLGAKLRPGFKVTYALKNTYIFVSPHTQFITLQCKNNLMDGLSFNNYEEAWNKVLELYDKN